MSRSIHTTLRTLGRLEEEAATGGKDGQARLETARQKIVRKRLVKRAVRKERAKSIGPLETRVDFISVMVLDQDEHIHHGASREDVLAVIRRLPTSATDGLAKIQLSLGLERQVNDLLESPAEHVCDPFTRRPGLELFPGVFSGRTLGLYMLRSGLISIFAFVVDAKAILLPRPALNLYLRLHALKTLVHEVAHHHDRCDRVARGRWLADQTDKLEDYARHMEQRWALEVVIPYLESTYPDEVESLIAWTERHSGIRLPLRIFAGDSGKFFSAHQGFESWMRNLPAFRNAIECRFDLAGELHLSDENEICLAILDQIPAVDVAPIKVAILRGYTLIRLSRFEEATHVASEILALDPCNDDALNIRGDVFEAAHDWRALQENSDRRLSHGMDNVTKRGALVCRAVAFCGLGDYAAMDVLLAEIEQLPPIFPNRNARHWRDLVFRRAGKEEEVSK